MYEDRGRELLAFRGTFCGKPSVSCSRRFEKHPIGKYRELLLDQTCRFPSCDLWYPQGAFELVALKKHLN